MDIKEIRVKISALRKALETLEEELGDESPSPRKRKVSFKRHLDETSAIGIWRKPIHLKKASRQKGVDV